MLFCRFCGTELDKNNDVCPSCGKNNNFKKPAKKVNKKVVITIVAAILLVAALVPAIIFGAKWIQRINRPNDLYYKDCYTLSVEEMAAHRDTVVATYGEHTLTNKLLQVFYWARVYEFMNYVGNYASYYGLNYSLPFSEQVYDQETGKTWEQMFLEQAIMDWKNYTIMIADAKEAGFTLTEAQQETMAALKETTEQKVTDSKGKYADVDAYLSDIICPGCTFEEYKAYNDLVFVANAYYTYLSTTWEITDAEMDTFYSENAATMKSEYGIDKESGNLISVRHILIEIEGGTEDENGKMVYTDEDWENCRKEAQKILDLYLAGDKTEDSFAKLATEHTDDTGSKENGGLYTGINKNTSFVKPFLNWCIDESRKVGDTDLVKSTYGYHVMYFVESELGWVLYCRDGIRAEKNEAYLAKLQEANPIEVDYKHISVVATPLT